jgi:hypothetical protein
LGYEDAAGQVAQQGKQLQYNHETAEITRYFGLIASALVFDLS